MEHSVLNGISWSNPSLKFHGSIRKKKEEVERLYEPEVIGDSKKRVSSRNSRIDVHINSQRLWQHAQGIHRFTSVGVPVLRGESGHS